MSKCRNPGCGLTITVPAGKLQTCNSFKFGTCVPMAAGLDRDVPFGLHSVEFQDRADRLLEDLMSLPDPGMIATTSVATVYARGVRSARLDMLAEFADEVRAACLAELHVEGMDDE